MLMSVAEARGAQGSRSRSRATCRAAPQAPQPVTACHDEDDVPCTVCGLRDDPSHTLLCDGDGCERAFHLYCLQPPLLQVPTGKWRCPECTERWRETVAGSEELARELYEAEVRQARNLRRQRSH